MLATHARADKIENGLADAVLSWVARCGSPLYGIFRPRHFPPIIRTPTGSAARVGSDLSFGLGFRGFIRNWFLSGAKCGPAVGEKLPTHSKYDNLCSWTRIRWHQHKDHPVMSLRIILVGVGLLVTTTAASFAAPTDTPAKNAEPAAADFARLYKEWKTVLSQLANLKIQYRTADAQQQTEIQAKWGPLMDQATALKDKVMAAAQKAYAAAPNADPQVTDLLVTLLQQWLPTRRLRAGVCRGKLLLDHGCADRQVPNLTGIAAFAVNEYDAAETCLTVAQKESPLTRTTPEKVLTAAALRLSNGLGQGEKPLREAEAKADDLPRVLLKTSKGDIELELFENEAPNTVANFISLVEKGFYNGLTFHRVLAGSWPRADAPRGTAPAARATRSPTNSPRPTTGALPRQPEHGPHGDPDTGRLAVLPDVRARRRRLDGKLHRFRPGGQGDGRAGQDPAPRSG